MVSESNFELMVFAITKRTHAARYRYYTGYLGQT